MGITSVDASRKMNLLQMVLAAMMLALALVLPILTGQIREIGNMLCPMHIPVLLCGFFCGPVYGAVVGLIAPLLRFVIFGMPPLMPIGVAMCFELATYGFISGLLYKMLPKKKFSIYVSLVSAMICGRVVWGVARVILYGLGKSEFGWAAFLSGAFFNAIPGIILQIILIPILVMIVRKVFPNIKNTKLQKH